VKAETLATGRTDFTFFKNGLQAIETTDEMSRLFVSNVLAAKGSSAIRRQCIAYRLGLPECPQMAFTFMHGCSFPPT
jgi:hypothetical protein